MPQPRRLYVVRHALPDYRGNKAGDEPPGPPLSDIGRCQAAQTADFLAAHVRAADLPTHLPATVLPDHLSAADLHAHLPAADPAAPARLPVYSSPLARARQTAAAIASAVGGQLRIDSDLKEWHRTDSLYDVTERCARFLRRWLQTGEPCAAAVSHGSPVLAILRTALYMPHRGWADLCTFDRFEVAMGSAFELTIDADRATARRLFCPSPRILESVRGRRSARFPKRSQVPENCTISRPTFARLIGWPPSR